MESFGDKLRHARETRGCSFDQAGRETNIARRYLEALETEDFAQFPGEPYLLGFLRNYGEYLGLNVNELLSLYRAVKIQEQPIPVEQLLKDAPSFPKALAVILCVFGFFLVAGLFVYFIFIRAPSEPAQSVVQLPMEYILEGTFLERRFYRGDTVQIPLKDGQYKVELRSMDDPLTLTVPGGTEPLYLFGQTDVDLNGDGIADLRVTLSDYDKSRPDSGAFIRFDINAPAVADTALAPVTTEEAAQSGAGTVIFSSTNTYPFTMDIQFQGYCMFRWEVDRRERTERYFSRGDRQNIPVQNTIRLWTSNATAVTAELNGAGRTVTLNLGSAGEVVVIDLRWLRDNDGRYRLTQYRLE